MKNDLEELMSASLELALAEREGVLRQESKHLVPQLRIFNNLNDGFRKSADGRICERVSIAVEEILCNRPPPPLANFERDGFLATEICILGEQLVKRCRESRKRKGLPVGHLPATAGPAPHWYKRFSHEVRSWKRKDEPSPSVPTPTPPADTTVRALAPLWRGIWEAGISYAANVLTVDKSALWVSERPTSIRPGEPDSGWRMIIKSPNRKSPR